MENSPPAKNLGKLATKPFCELAAFSPLDDDDGFSFSLSTVKVDRATADHEALLALSAKLSDFQSLFNEERAKLERGLIAGQDSIPLLNTFLSQLEQTGDDI